MTNKEEIFDLIKDHPEGLDDDDIAQLTGIQPRQQVQTICNQLANSRRIRRESTEKVGKRRKIHNFPVEQNSMPRQEGSSDAENWRRRLSALVAATGRTENDLLEESLQLLAMRVLRDDDFSSRPPNEDTPPRT
jgi:hypothetical protein